MEIDKYSLLALTFLFEFIELSIFYANTLEKMLYKLFIYYQKSIFYFFFLHFGYLWLLFLVFFIYNFHWAFIVAIIFKSFDIFTQIELIKKFQQSQEESEFGALLKMKIPLWAIIIAPLFYPYMVYLAFF